MVFPVVMYGHESWTIKKAECRIDAFELWCWRKLLRVPWTARRSNESILKEISPGCSLEGLMLKPKLQYFGHLIGRADSLEKTLMLGKIEGRKRRGWQRMRWLDGITNLTDMSLSKLQEMGRTGKPGMLQSMGSQRVRRDLATEQQLWVSNASERQRTKQTGISAFLQKFTDGHDQATPFLRYGLKRNENTGSHTTCTLTFTEAMVIVVKQQKEPKCPSSYEQIKYGIITRRNTIQPSKGTKP